MKRTDSNIIFIQIISGSNEQGSDVSTRNDTSSNKLPSSTLLNPTSSLMSVNSASSNDHRTETAHDRSTKDVQTYPVISKQAKPVEEIENTAPRKQAPEIVSARQHDFDDEIELVMKCIRKNSLSLGEFS